MVQCSCSWLKNRSRCVEQQGALRVVGFLQLLARFAVDTTDGIFERTDGLGQVGRLCIEESLALGGRGQFFQRRQIDRGACRTVARRLRESRRT